MTFEYKYYRTESERVFRCHKCSHRSVETEGALCSFCNKQEELRKYPTLREYMKNPEPLTETEQEVDFRDRLLNHLREAHDWIPYTNSPVVNDTDSLKFIHQQKHLPDRTQPKQGSNLGGKNPHE